MSLYLALVHYPIKNKVGELITTSVTNLDIHDISRSCYTFGVKGYYLVTPLLIQHDLVKRILGHWERDINAAYNPHRHQALGVARLSESFERACEEIAAEEGRWPKTVVTGANFGEKSLSCESLRRQRKIDDGPYLLVFGTGWGLHQELVEKADFQLKPIVGCPERNYNHLSVRSAVAIYLDRLFNGKSERDEKE